MSFSHTVDPESGCSVDYKKSHPTTELTPRDPVS
jgi:hypothetical protein